MGQKHKRFRKGFRKPFPLRDIRENPRSNVHACAAGDGAICSKNRKIVPYHGANPNTRNGARLRSPSLIMGPGCNKERDRPGRRCYCISYFIFMVILFQAAWSIYLKTSPRAKLFLGKRELENGLLPYVRSFKAENVRTDPNRTDYGKLTVMFHMLHSYESRNLLRVLSLPYIKVMKTIRHDSLKCS